MNLYGASTLKHTKAGWAHAQGLCLLSLYLFLVQGQWNKKASGQQASDGESGEAPEKGAGQVVYEADDQGSNQARDAAGASDEPPTGGEGLRGEELVGQDYQGT